MEELNPEGTEDLKARARELGFVRPERIVDLPALALQPAQQSPEPTAHLAVVRP